MSISKLLMTAAVFTVTMSAVSTSYASGTDLTTADSNTASMRNLAAFDGSGVTPRLPIAEVAVAARDDDSKSVMSSMSTMSAIDQGRLEKSWDALWAMFRTTLVSAPKLPKEASKLLRVEKYAAAVVDSHNGFMKIAVVAQADLKATLEALGVTEAETAALKEGTITRQAFILQKIAEEKKALTEAETKLAKTQEAAKTWQNSTLVTSGVLTIVVGVLINIVRQHGWAILWR